MKKRKLVLALMLSLMMLVTMIPSFSFADGTSGTGSGAASGTISAATSGNCGATGSDVKWNFDTATGTLTISGNGAMADYVADETEGNHIPWDAWKDEVKEIVVKNGVTHIGSRSFVSMSTLNHVSIANSVTSIGDRAFSESSVKSVDLPAVVTELEDATFYQCPQLDTIDLSHIQIIGKNVFEGCAFKSVELPSVQNIGNFAFQNCTALESVKLGEGVTELLTGTFKNCTKLKNVELPNSLKTIGGYTFYNTAISEIDLRNINTISSTYAFAECKNLENIKMDSLQGTLFRYTFNNCTSLKSVTIPGTITSIESPAFNGCTALADLTFEAGESTLSIAEQKALSGLKTLKIDRDIKITEKAGGFTNWSTDGLELIIGDNVATLPARVLVGNSSKDLLVNKIVFGRNIKTVDQYAFTGNNTVKLVDMTALNAAPSSMDLSLMISGSVIYVSTKEMADTLIGTNDADGRNYAKWKTGVAVLNGGMIPDNSTIELKKLIVPEKKNAIFSGWYSDPKMTQTVTDNTMTSVASDYGKYYARWEDKQDRTISVKSIEDKVYDTRPIELDKSNCTVEGTGNITFSYEQKVGDDWVKLDRAPFNVGMYRVKATIAEDDTYKSATSADYVTFNINKADQKLSYNTEKIEKHAGDAAFTNKLTKTTVDGELTYASSNEKVATVNETTGEVTIVGAGEAIITATATATPNYNEATASYELTVTRHVFSNQWSSDTKGHWHACTVNGCAVKADAEDHDFEWVVDKEAITTEKGSKHKECTVCGYKEAAVEIPVIENGTTGGDQNSGNAGNSTKADTANGSKTGDAMPIGMLAVLMLAAAAGIAFCGRKLYKSR